MKLFEISKKLWPGLFIALLTIIFFYTVWLKGLLPLPLDALVGIHIPWTEVRWEGYPAGVPIKNPEITDSISQFYPWRSLVGEFWREGKAPLWNFYMFSGTPFLATWHSAALYPLNALYLFLSNSAAWTGLVVFQVLLAGVFMYLFLTTLGLRKEASLLGAISFSFSGYMIGWLEFATGGHAGLWLPLLLLLQYKLVESGRAFWVLPIALAFFLIYTAGDFQVPLYITVLYLLFGAYLIFRRKKRRLVNTFSVGTAILSGVFLAAPQLLPALELFSQSVRISDSYIKEFYFGLMTWEKAVNFIWPDFFGNVVTGNYWGKYTYHEYMSFVGSVALVFVVFSLLSRKKAVEKFFWFTLVGSLLFLFPTPIAFLPYELNIPGLGTSFASRIIYVTDFSLAALAAYGLSKWQEGEKADILKIIFYFLVVTAGILLGLGISTFIIDRHTPGFTPQILINLLVGIKNIIPTTLALVLLGIFLFVGKKILPRFKINLFNKLFILLGALGIVLLASAEMLRFAWKNTPFSPRQFLFPETQTISFLKNQEGEFRIAGGIPTNLFMPYKIESAEGYDPLYPARYAAFLSAINHDGSIASPTGRYGHISGLVSPLLNFADTRFIVDFKKGQFREPNDEGKYDKNVVSFYQEPDFTEGRVGVFENPHNPGRIWLSGNYSVSKDDMETIARINSLDAVRSRLVVLEKEPAISVEEKTPQYEITGYREGKNKIEAKVATEDNALLFLSQTYYPGWRAFIDGKETEIYRANYTFQSIAVTRGEHKVEFIYSPQSYRIGKWISFATAAFLAALAFVSRKYESRPKKSS